MKKLRVAVHRHPSRGYGLTFPYNSRLVDTLKSRVAKENREYDPTTHTWWLSRSSDLAEVQWATNQWAECVRVGGEWGGKRATR